MEIPDLALPEWLENAEKYDVAPDGVRCRAVNYAGRTWYLPLTREDLAQIAVDEQRNLEKVREDWARYDAWLALTLEEKVARLGPQPPTVPRPPRTDRR